jgi:dTDP-4-amino-4,6-dideoxygalactose transaminase
MIPMVDLKAQFAKLAPEMMPAIERVMTDAAYINGPDVKLFEGEAAQALGAKHAIGCANGTDALQIAVRALGIGPGDEVITTAFTFVATGGAISICGATPVFVDVDATSFNIDVTAIEAAITPRTKAIVPVHLYGNPVDMDAIMAIADKHHLAVIEDCAQATAATWKGRTVGTIGHVGCFSFFPSKNLGCAGDGGMCLTNDSELADKIRAIGAHGSRVRYHNDIQGFNSRLDTLQAAILRVKLPHLPAWNNRRREVACKYSEVLAGTGVLTPQGSEHGRHVFHQYTVRHPERDRIQAHLQSVGVATAVYYPIPLHKQKMFAHLGYQDGQLPVSEALSRDVFSLPICPELSDENIAFIGKEIAQALAVTAAH